MRADRLVSLVLLLRQRGRLSATVLARELEVSTRTVLRDVEALSAAGVPIYAERGRHGGFALLPGFRTELTGLNPDEALAVLAASGRGEHVLGLGPALASAVRKIVDALPEAHRDAADHAARRILVEPAIDLLARRQAAEEIPAAVLHEVRRAVLDGRRLRIRYAAVDRPPTSREVDPVGMVTSRGTGYLLATVGGSDRTYRLSRILAAEALAEPADRPDVVDLDQLWRERSARFRAGDDQVVARVRLVPDRREALVGTAVSVHAESVADDGLLVLDVTFQDLRHAVWAVWQLGPDAEVLDPGPLRDLLRDRAVATARRYEAPGATAEGRPRRGRRGGAVVEPGRDQVVPPGVVHGSPGGGSGYPA
ncbi:helix-turn-helix transcriptional regulator [Cellulosimicrobium protaetiae]|uniref:WYL domain-containing protein n=1 Tax=Cellulosimicrobium protaetiae TaxID=2587808 RepID=A0A6M5U9K7_9MICO|nr:WYL domain-containing protein [Cellulosimicrobium protaetiae]QJW35166.1 WYL domain-containing protein [Cellulosimicrobium protaetiae]